MDKLNKYFYNVDSQTVWKIIGVKGTQLSAELVRINKDSNIFLELKIGHKEFFDLRDVNIDTWIIVDDYNKADILYAKR